MDCPNWQQLFWLWWVALSLFRLFVTHSLFPGHSSMYIHRNISHNKRLLSQLNQEQKIWKADYIWRTDPHHINLESLDGLPCLLSSWSAQLRTVWTMSKGVIGDTHYTCFVKNTVMAEHLRMLQISWNWRRKGIQIGCVRGNGCGLVHKSISRGFAVCGRYLHYLGDGMWDGMALANMGSLALYAVFLAVTPHSNLHLTPVQMEWAPHVHNPHVFELWVHFLLESHAQSELTGRRSMRAQCHRGLGLINSDVCFP